MSERYNSLVGVGPFRGTEHYIGTPGELPQGSDTMTVVLVTQLLRFPTGNEIPAGNGVSAGNPGFRFRFTSTPTYQLQILDGAGTSTVTATRASVLKAPVSIIGTNDGSQLRIHALGISDVAASRTPGTPTFGLALGASPSPSNPLTVGVILAFLASDAFLLPTADFAGYEAQLNDDIQNGRDLTFFRTPVAGEDVYWDARDLYDGSVSPRNTWTDRISGIELTRTAPNLRMYSVPGGPF